MKTFVQKILKLWNADRDFRMLMSLQIAIFFIMIIVMLFAHRQRTVKIIFSKPVQTIGNDVEKSSGMWDLKI
jgi:hypothetical protein